jgi:perosamine synthetase
MYGVQPAGQNKETTLGERSLIPIAKPVLGEEEKQAVLEVLDSGMIAQGPRTKAFEEAFARMCGTRFAIATSSGTSALQLALLAHKIGAGDEVITSAFTFIATASSILYSGARPVFVDIDPRTFNIDPSEIERVITPRTRAIMPVHLFGLICDMDAIMEIAARHNLAVIEDACQAHGAGYKGRRAGSFGSGAFSLYSTKNITCGEGGMVTTDDEEINECVRVMRNQGMQQRNQHDELGFNFRMTDIQAAIGLAQIAKLDSVNRKRQENAAFLSAALEGVLTPYIPEGCEHVFHQYTVRVPHGKRDALRRELRDQGIGAEIYYPLPIYRQSFYTRRFNNGHILADTEAAAGDVLSLPVHPSLSQTDLEYIASAVNKFMAG